MGCIRSLLHCILLSLPRTSCILWSAFLWAICSAPMIKREENCPLPGDFEWQQRNSNCRDGKAYHCFENEDRVIIKQGCYNIEECLKGGHPEVENERIICSICRSGFQPIYGLPSNRYQYSYCRRHRSPCDPEYGQSECRKPTEETDRGCFCDPALGFVVKFSDAACKCFTSDDACPMDPCRFDSCPNGTVKNNRGFCEPYPVTPPVTTRKPDFIIPTTPVANDDDGGGIPDYGIALLVLVPLALIAAVIFYVWRRHKPSQDGLNKPLAVPEEAPSPSPDPPDSTPIEAAPNNGLNPQHVYLPTVENLVLHHSGPEITFHVNKIGHTALGGSVKVNHPKPAKPSPVPEGANESAAETLLHPNEEVPLERDRLLPSEGPTSNGRPSDMPSLKPEILDESHPLLPPEPPPPAVDPSAPDLSIPYFDAEDDDETARKVPREAGSADETDETELKKPVISNQAYSADQRKTSPVPSVDRQDLSNGEETELKVPISSSFASANGKLPSGSEETKVKTVRSSGDASVIESKDRTAQSAEEYDCDISPR